MDKEFACTGFPCTIFENHCAKAANGEGEGGKTLAAKIPLNVTKNFARRVSIYWHPQNYYHPGQ